MDPALCAHFKFKNRKSTTLRLLPALSPPPQLHNKVNDDCQDQEKRPVGSKTNDEVEEAVPPFGQAFPEAGKEAVFFNLGLLMLYVLVNFDIRLHHGQ